MKILNLYAGIGGNRKLWGDEHEITAVENNESIAAIYQDFFPNDTVIVGDAHQYLLDNYKEFDFIWSSPPCPTHSQLGRLRVFSDSKRTGAHKSVAKYPNMGLYQEILLLKHFFKGDWVVENVIAYYNPLIPPAAEIGRHHYWSNRQLHSFSQEGDSIEFGKRSEWEARLGFDLSKYSGIRKDTVLRNCVNPEIGLYLLNKITGAIPPIQEGLFERNNK